MTLFNRIVREEDGQDMVEYVLIFGLVSIIAVLAVTATGTSIQGLWNSISATVAAAP